MKIRAGYLPHISILLSSLVATTLGQANSTTLFTTTSPPSFLNGTGSAAAPLVETVQVVVETEVVNVTTAIVTLTTAVVTLTEPVPGPTITVLEVPASITVITTTSLLAITLCAPRTINPTYTVATPQPTEYTWGCPPGYLCKPPQVGCNFEAGVPLDGFYCAPEECVPAAALPVPQLWGAVIYGNETPATDPSLKFNPIDSYFNINPTDFGLDYTIFEQVETLVYTSTVVPAATVIVGARQAEATVPGACYPECNNAMLEAESVGKTEALCAPGSPYLIELSQCEACITYHQVENSNVFVEIAPQFQQFLLFCQQYPTPTPTPPPPPPTTTPAPVIPSSVTPTPAMFTGGASSLMRESSFVGPGSNWSLRALYCLCIGMLWT